MGEAAASDGTGQIRRGLAERIVRQVVAAGGVRGGEPGQLGLRIGWPPKLQQATMKLVAAALGNNIYDAARAASEFGREGVREHVHFVQRVERQVGENGLPAPTV